MHTTLISATELQQLLKTDADVRVIDCSADLMDPTAGRRLYEQLHVAGSLHADLDTDLSEKSHPASSGRHPLPAREVFAATLQRLGVNNGSQVVVLDRAGIMFSGRLWWMLKWCGHEAVAVLDGGLAAWQAAGGAVGSGPAPTVPAGDFRLGPTAATALTTDDVQALMGRPDRTLVDARAAARFRGETEPLDPVAGHIPGALNRPFGENLLPDGRFKPAEVLRAEFERLLAGRDPAGVVHQCGSGVSAVPNLLAMELAGLGRAALYPGSWSAWCNTPGTARAQG
ncbi:sulfurtransferase [uncultured Hydrogenophaga sp.]|uniref:sulfurtransferase n=1 Tax=uncultured Hydrogenophaga sp. TaxID=199683 RepID=UPI00265FBAA1|nr:sulfurtransferase [uncultured Hydrogenophaga sp.]